MVQPFGHFRWRLKGQSPDYIDQVYRIILTDGNISQIKLFDLLSSSSISPALTWGATQHTKAPQGKSQRFFI